MSTRDRSITRDPSITRDASIARELSITLLLALLAGAVSADERILAYHSAITIHADASMIVEETIRVRAEGAQIRRGIYRDFPTDYRDALGNRYVVSFDVLSVLRDGAGEPWHAERRANGVRVYAGSAERLLPHGEHTYTLRYRTTRQLGYFADFDELYWNVTGNGWEFPIDSASATITLPETVETSLLGMIAYTGELGARASDYRAAPTSRGAVFETTRALGPREGLTVALRWPKGVVTEPTVFDRARWLLEDNAGLLLALAALAGSLAYLGVVWSRYGRDPEPGVIFPHYEPPAGYSPASARYVKRMGYDDRAFSAAVVNLAVKGQLRILERDGTFSLERFASNATLAPGEAVLAEKLFAEGGSIDLEERNHRVIGAARSAHRRALARDYQRIYFRNNTVKLLPSLIGSAALFAVVAMLGVLGAMVVVVGLLNVAVHAAFAYLLKAPTPRGRTLLDKLEGFKLYLEVAEKDDLELRHPPELTPELFERYLPYAIALGVEQAWAARFTAVFASLGAAGAAGYRPTWYGGAFDAARPVGFAERMSAEFTSAIAAAATPPGSSSGSGGGGSSGGGGGGGGGGGW